MDMLDEGFELCLGQVLVIHGCIIQINPYQLMDSYSNFAGYGKALI
jgi:hypothetical protein